MKMPFGVVLQQVQYRLDLLRRLIELDQLGQLVDDLDQVFVLNVDGTIPCAQRFGPQNLQ
jgi:hypothetical protein